MTCKSSCVVVALFVIAAVTAKGEPKHPPNHHGADHHGDDHHGDEHHGHENNGENHQGHEHHKISNVSQEEIVNENASVDEVQDAEANEDISEFVTKNSSLESRQAEIEADNVLRVKSLVSWTTCDFGIIPRKRCHDCRARLICKSPNAGKVIDCNKTSQPYCNNGYCSSIPSVGCS